MIHTGHLKYPHPTVEVWDSTCISCNWESIPQDQSSMWIQQVNSTSTPRTKGTELQE